MFSKKMVVIIGLIALVTVNFTILSITSKNRHKAYGLEGVAIPFMAPFQDLAGTAVAFLRDTWHTYFNLIDTGRENTRLTKELKRLEARVRWMDEISLANARLRKLLNFQETLESRYISAEIIGTDPSSWFKTLIIDKGSTDGVQKGFAVVVSEGIVGQVAHVSSGYAKVLLLIDPNSAVDALIQRTRARGVIQGRSGHEYHLKYVLQKHDARVGDKVVSSGLDGVFPKGLSLGVVVSASKDRSGIFQNIIVRPFVDFEKLEEVFVLLNHQNRLTETE